MDFKLFNAILAMDAYNRGYGASIKLPDSVGQGIGIATISDVRGDVDAQDIGFYAVAYDVGGAGKIISYRGTDEPTGSIPIFYAAESGSDIWNGWSVGAGSIESQQAAMAFQFYDAVSDGIDPRSAAIVTTGHSLGGGLAGLVAGAYGKQGLLFDNMPFEYALARTKAYAEIGIHDLDKLVYQGTTPWATNLSHLESISMEGEILFFLRITQVGTPDTFYNIGPDVNLVLGPDAIALHSMPALVIRMFAKTEIDGPSNWEKSAQHFWPLMYNDDFAEQVGVFTSPDTAGKSKDSGKYASILQSIIAYSAIDKGEKPFGDTAIRALYNDANDFGKALSVEDYVRSPLDGYETEISQALVQFAGQLALSKIKSEQFANSPINPNDGLITHIYHGKNGSELLDISFSDFLWKAINSNTLPPQVARDALAGKIFTTLAADIDFALNSKNAFEAAIQEQWSVPGSFSVNAPGETDFIDRVVFAKRDNSLARIKYDTYDAYEETGNASAPDGPTIDKVTIFVGAKGTNGGLAGDDDVVMEFSHISETNELILTDLGNDTIYASRGNDIIYGGTKDDINLVDFDVVDYRHLDADITVTVLDKANGNYRVDKSFNEPADIRLELGLSQNSTDYLFSIEDILGLDRDAEPMVLPSAGGEAFNGDDEDNYLSRNGNYDSFTIDGKAGEDRLIGGYGNDLLIGGPDDDQIQGGRGDDTYVVSFGHGNDWIYENGSTTDVDTLQFGAGIAPEDLVLARLDDRSDVTVTLSNSDNLLINNQVSARSIDFFKFADGTVWDMEEVVVPVYGTEGRDTLIGTSESSAYREGSSINDEIYGGGGADNILTYNGINTVKGGDETETTGDRITGGNDIDYLYGEDGKDSIKGAGGNDFVSGGRHNDTLKGENGDDVLWGGEGSDLIDGGNGNDYIEGGPGRDSLLGGYNTDRFIFKKGDGPDTIRDFLAFGSHKDVIDLSHYAVIENFGDLELTYAEVDRIPSVFVSSDKFDGLDSLLLQDIATSGGIRIEEVTADDFIFS